MDQPTKDPSGIINVTFDFSDLSSSTPSAATVTNSVYQGTDTTPLVIGSNSISGTVVTQPITGGTAGMIYDLRCTATIGGNSYVKGKVLAVRTLP